MRCSTSLDSEYIKLARAKGVTFRKIVWVHGFRNAIIPPLTVAALIFAAFLTGTVVVETVFAWARRRTFGRCSRSRTTTSQS